MSRAQIRMTIIFRVLYFLQPMSFDQFDSFIGYQGLFHFSERTNIFEEMSDSEFFILLSPNLSLAVVIPRHSNVGKLSVIGSRNLPGLVFE